MDQEIAGWIGTGCEVMADMADDYQDQHETPSHLMTVASEVHALIAKRGINAILSALSDGAQSAADVQDATVSGKLTRKRLLDAAHILRVDE
jgi:hypothetical protein